MKAKDAAGSGLALLTREPSAREIEELAKALWWKTEALDPVGDGPWIDLDEIDRNYFRACISFVLAHMSAAHPGRVPTTTS